MPSSLPLPKAPRESTDSRPRQAWSRLLLLLVALPIGSCLPFDGFVPELWMQARQQDYLAFATATPMSPSSMANVLVHLERDARDSSYRVPRGSIPDDAWDAVFEKVWRLRDTSDFDVLRMLDLLYAFPEGHPAASPVLWQKLEDAVLGFKYWYVDPTPARFFEGAPVVDQMWYWTENHILIFRACEYLAGRKYPNRIFEVTGLTGEQHATRARQAILDWIDERARFGFTEWHSDVYYALSWRPLLALVEWSDDPLIAQRAAMLLDLLFLDVALQVHRGNFGATHGRSYVKDKLSADTQNTFDGVKFFFDGTELSYPSPSSSTGAVLARARRYRLPEVIRRIAAYDEPMVGRQRMNLPLDEVPPSDPASTPPPEAPFGLDYRDEANLPFWWSMGAQPVWMILPLTLIVGERENLFDAQFADFKPLFDLVWNPLDVDESIAFAQTLAQVLWPMINQSLLKEVNTYTYRTAHYMLSTAQDYRKGVRGSQTHTWQATLSERAIVFTQHPAYLPPSGDAIPANWNWQERDEPGPGYWTGEASQPRAAQHENVAIIMYARQYPRSPQLGFTYNGETHAYFPVAHFDEVVQEGHWTFGRKEDGYVALYSWRPTEWRRGLPEAFQNAGLDFDLVAGGGANNVWMVECGSLDEWPGGFEAFRAAVAASHVVVEQVGDLDGNGFPDGFTVSYDSPSRGRIELGWDGPLVVNGVPEALDGYPRMENPFVQVEFGETRYEVREGGYSLLLDFATNERRAAAPPGASQLAPKAAQRRPPGLAKRQP
jgi:hypothetical protein